MSKVSNMALFEAIKNKLSYIFTTGIKPTASEKITTGEYEALVTGTGTGTWTAPADCIVYIRVSLQANSSGNFAIRVNNYRLFDYVSNGAVRYGTLIPVFMHKDDVLTVDANNNSGIYITAFSLDKFGGGYCIVSSIARRLGAWYEQSIKSRVTKSYQANAVDNENHLDRHELHHDWKLRDVLGLLRSIVCKRRTEDYNSNISSNIQWNYSRICCNGRLHERIWLWRTKRIWNTYWVNKRTSRCVGEQNLFLRHKQGVLDCNRHLIANSKGVFA